MKNYKNREAILKDIDSAHRKIAKANRVAQEHLDQEELLTGVDAQLSELRRHREAADFQFRKIKRLKDKRLPALGATLAEFDTANLIPPDTQQGTAPPVAPPSQPEPCVESNDVPQ